MERVHFRIGKTKWPDGSHVVGCEVIVWSPYGFSPPQPRVGFFQAPALQATKSTTIQATTDQPDRVTCRGCRRSEVFHKRLVEHIKRATPRGQQFGRHCGSAPKSVVDPIRRCRGSWRCLGIECGKPSHRERAKEWAERRALEETKPTKRVFAMSRTRTAREQPPQEEQET